MRFPIILHLFGAIFLLQGCVVDRAGVVDPGGLPRVCIPGCDNGGICVSGTCDCSTIDYQGPTCSDAIDDCDGVDCHNGDCVDAVRDAVCNCDQGWTLGEAGLCTVKIRSCDTPNACVHGDCEDESGEVVCDCDDGYTGTNCNLPVNCGSPPQAPANSTLAEMTGTEYGDSAVYECHGDGSEEIECEADGSWESLSLNCSSENPCEDSPCDHGDCENPEPYQFECDCDKGWTGDTCSEDIDECDDNDGFGPCDPDGTDECDNTPGSFDCDCDSDHGGKFCDKPPIR